MANDLVQRVAESVQDSMDEILANFKSGARITVLVRTPGKPSADFCMTDDDLDEVIMMVHRRKSETSTTSPISVADYATRLFDLHGFMLLETYRGKHAVTVTFPDLKEAQQFHNTLVELSTHRPRPLATSEGQP